VTVIVVVTQVRMAVVVVVEVVKEAHLLHGGRTAGIPVADVAVE